MTETGHPHDCRCQRKVTFALCWEHKVQNNESELIDRASSVTVIKERRRLACLDPSPSDGSAMVLWPTEALESEGERGKDKNNFIGGVYHLYLTNQHLIVFGR